MSLKTQLANYQARMQEISDEIEAVGAAAEIESRDLNDEDNAMIATLSDEYDRVASSAQAAQKALAATEKIRLQRELPAVVAAADDRSRRGANNVSGLPARVRGQRSKVFDTNKDAFDCGMSIYAMIGHRRAKEYCTSQGIEIRNAMEEGTPSLGGYSVPVEMANTIIRLVEQFGVARQFCRNYPMASNVTDIPMRTAGLSVNYIGEGLAITPSDLTFGTAQLVAKKPAMMSVLSTELDEDSVINVVDLITTEMAMGFAYNEDNQVFNGTGSPIEGIFAAVAAGSKVNVATADAITLDDLHAAMGKLPRYPGIMPRWFFNAEMFHTNVAPLLDALGGTTQRMFEEGPQMMLLGYPVTFTNVLASAGAAGVGVFGDLSQGSVLGTRRQVTIKRLDELYAANDQIGIQATMRHDFVVVDPGTAGAAGAIITINSAA